MSRTWRWVTAIVATAACMVLALVVIFVVVPGRDVNAIHDASALPARIQVCGRIWTTQPNAPQFTMEEARAFKSSGEPSIVATGPFAPCPPGPCQDVDTGPCDTVVFVRIGQDAYVDYSLSGGP
jgi:hypothetical protein